MARARTKPWKGIEGIDRGYTRRKAVVDSRDDAGIKRHRTLLKTYLTYQIAADQAFKLGPDDGTIQVRKNRDGFGVYRRERV